MPGKMSPDESSAANSNAEMVLVPLLLRNHLLFAFARIGSRCAAGQHANDGLRDSEEQQATLAVLR